MSLQDTCIWFERLFRILLLLSCLGIVTWQCWRCYTKFLSMPQATQLSVVSSAGNMFPIATVCPNAEEQNEIHNFTILYSCGITANQYRFQAEWSNQTNGNCSNPKLLYYSIIWKMEDLISKV